LIFLECFLGPFDDASASQGWVIIRYMTTCAGLLRQDVVEVDYLLDVGIGAWIAPSAFLFRR